MLPLHKNLVVLFLCGDVMTGRGIDQVLPHPGDPRLFESYLRDARDYARLARGAGSSIPATVDFTYIWGDALAELERMAPDARIVNLETAVTRSDDAWPHKGINYRMHPANLPVLTVARIDVATLANNHVLDWGYDGLSETLDVLRKANIKSAGAGGDLAEAEAPALVETGGKGRVLVLAAGDRSSGIPADWTAAPQRPGVNRLEDLSNRTIRRIATLLRAVRKPGDLVVLSIHWGGNWGWEIPRTHKEFARRLIDDGRVDVVYGHSSHHVKGIEVYRDRLILYGCGDFINDYEGIKGFEEFRGDLGLMYFVHLEPATGKLAGLKMIPTRIRDYSVIRASHAETLWLCDMLNREGKNLGTRVECLEDNTLALRWK
jgi:poly-gamma-glutamate synthesis protein (capsule biosynthesis protein)